MYDGGEQEGKVTRETKLMSITLGVMPLNTLHVTPNPHRSLSSQHFPLLILLLKEFICLLIPPHQNLKLMTARTLPVLYPGLPSELGMVIGEGGGTVVNRK